MTVKELVELLEKYPDDYASLSMAMRTVLTTSRQNGFPLQKYS